MVSIIDFKPIHQPWFEKLNRAWIEKYFWMEEIDKYVLQYPEEAILGKGGYILMATWNKEIVGTVALKKLDNRVYEFTKMAVDEAYRGKGIGEALSRAAIKKCSDLGAELIILYSQTGLVAAINMYKKLGFREVPIDTDAYKRSDIKMQMDRPVIDSILKHGMPLIKAAIK